MVADRNPSRSSRRQRVAAVGLALAALSSTRPFAGTRLGGDDTGFVPPDATAARCEDGVARRVARFVGELIRCETRAADLAVQTLRFDEEGCEARARRRYVTAIGQFLGPPCPPCLKTADVGGAEATRALIEASVRLVYCSGTTALGADDPGYVPPDTGTAGCEGGVARHVAKLVAGLVHCHVRSADAPLSGAIFHEEACEDAAAERYTAGTAQLAGCPACLHPGTVGVLARAVVESNNGDVYCASPGGAFLEDGR